MLDLALGTAICLLIIQSVRAAGWKKIAKAAQKGNCELRDTANELRNTAKKHQEKLAFFDNVHRTWATMLKPKDIVLMIDGEIVRPLESEETTDTDWPEVLN